MKKNTTVVYKLSGRSLMAAKRLEAELTRELKTAKVLQAGNMKDIHDSWDAMYQGLLARLKKEAPEVLDMTGLTSRAVQVRLEPQTLPRAYADVPAIFLSPEKNPEYFMYVPVDYNGRHFAPADGILLSEQEEKATGDRLFAGGWLGNAPLVSVRREGVALPADYAPPPQSVLRKDFPYRKNDRVCFLAKGRSLAAVEDFKAREVEWKARLQDARRAIEAAVGKLKPDMLAQLPAGEDVRISASYSYYATGGKTTLTLSVRRAGNLNVFHGGKSVPVPPSPALLLEPRGGGEYTVKTRTDTPEGRALAKVIDNVPDTPSLADYAELHGNFDIKQDDIGVALGINGVMPQLHALAGYIFLLYTAAPDSDKSGFCPPDAQPFPAFAYEWLNSDEMDKNRGDVPPPMPKTIADLLSDLQQDAPEKDLDGLLSDMRKKAKARRKKHPPRP